MATMIARFVPSMKHRITSLLVLAALTCAFGAARAEKADRSKPMNIEADALRHDEVKQTSVFSGRVVMTKGSIVLRGARLDVRQDADGYQSGIVTAEAGKRAFFRQKRDTLPGAPEEFIEGEGEVIEYDGRTDNVRFITRAELRRWMREMAAHVQVEPQRISFHTASYAIVNLLAVPSLDSAGTLPKQLAALLAQSRHFVLRPRRTGRSFPRVVKKRASKFPTKKMPVSS